MNLPTCRSTYRRKSSKNIETGLAAHWHALAQHHANRRTFVQVTREQVYYRDLPKCLVGGRFSARDTAWVWTDATPIKPLQHHSSQSCANLMSIQCQSSANLISIHHLSDVDPSPVRCRSSANRSQSGAKSLKCQSPKHGRRQFIGNPVPIQHKSISNPSIGFAIIYQSCIRTPSTRSLICHR